MAMLFTRCRTVVPGAMGAAAHMPRGTPTIARVRPPGARRLAWCESGAGGRGCARALEPMAHREDREPDQTGEDRGHEDRDGGLVARVVLEGACGDEDGDGEPDALQGATPPMAGQSSSSGSCMGVVLTGVHANRKPPTGAPRTWPSRMPTPTWLVSASATPSSVQRHGHPGIGAGRRPAARRMRSTGGAAAPAGRVATSPRVRAGTPPRPWRRSARRLSRGRSP
jgi:hypothetical protein